MKTHEYKGFEFEYDYDYEYDSLEIYYKGEELGT